MGKNYLLVTMCVLCLLSLFVMPVFSVDDAATLKIRIAKLEAEAVNHQKAIADYEKQLKLYKDKCSRLYRENSRLKVLCRRNGISTNITERRGERSRRKPKDEDIIFRAVLNEGKWFDAAKLIRVLDERTALIEIDVICVKGIPRSFTYGSDAWDSLFRSGIDLRRLRHGWVSVPDRRRFIFGDFLTEPQTFLLKGINTSNYVDGSTIEINSYCEITGTETRKTAPGAKIATVTYFVLEPIETP